MLTRHFLSQSARQLGVEPKRISDTALLWLGRFAYPGNVRQLENICHWLTVMAPAQVIESKDLPPEIAVVAEPASGAFTPTAKGAPLEALAAGLEGGPAVTGAVASAAVVNQPLAEPVTSTRSPMGVTSMGWEQGLDQEANALLATDRTDVWDVLTARFESRLIQAALAATRGRRIEAAQKLGIGRNTITRKIQELGLE
jgi:two-component system nitrogen regulation response regulator GlnG